MERQAGLEERMARKDCQKGLPERMARRITRKDRQKGKPGIDTQDRLTSNIARVDD